MRTVLERRKKEGGGIRIAVKGNRVHVQKWTDDGQRRFSSYLLRLADLQNAKMVGTRGHWLRMKVYRYTTRMRDGSYYEHQRFAWVELLVHKEAVMAIFPKHQFVQIEESDDLLH